MADCKPRRRGGRYCVAGAPNKQSCTNTTFTPGITMHQFPLDPITREKWVKFVQKHRRDFRHQSKYTSLCSAHFDKSCYNYPIQLEGIKMNKTLKKGSIPTRDAVTLATSIVSVRRKQQLRRDIMSQVNEKSPKITSHEASSSNSSLVETEPTKSTIPDQISEDTLPLIPSTPSDDPQSCCSHKDTLQNSNRSNNRLRELIAELRKTVSLTSMHCTKD